MNATAKFYTAFFAALVIVVAVSFAIGYRAGFAHAIGAQARSHAIHNAAVRATATP